MLFKQTMNPPSCRARFAENVQNINKFPATVHITWLNYINKGAPAGKRGSFSNYRELWGLLEWHDCIIYFCPQPARPAPSHRLVKPVSGPSPSPAGWPSPQTWWSSMVILTWWWSAWLCCSGWWGWRGARGPQGPEGGSCHTSLLAYSDLAAPKREGTR